MDTAVNLSEIALAGHEATLDDGTKIIIHKVENYDHQAGLAHVITDHHKKFLINKEGRIFDMHNHPVGQTIPLHLAE